MNAALSARSPPATIQSAYIWTVVGSFFRQFLTFGLSLLLARLLQPSDYGLIGMILVVTSLFGTVQDAGLEQAIVHFPENKERNATSFTLCVLMGALMSLIVFLGAPLFADFYKDPRLTALARAC